MSRGLYDEKLTVEDCEPSKINAKAIQVVDFGAKALIYAPNVASDHLEELYKNLFILLEESCVHTDYMIDFELKPFNELLKTENKED